MPGKVISFRFLLAQTICRFGVLLRLELSCSMRIKRTDGGIKHPVKSFSVLNVLFARDAR